MNFHRILSSCAFMLAVFVWTNDASANPNFSRKYKLDCSTCHTVPPQLSRTGIEFRRLGYRFPNELNQAVPVPAHTQEQGEQNSAAVTALTTAGCAGCHAVEPDQSGPSLQGVGAKRNADQIRAFVVSEKHPGAEIAKAAAPQDLEVIIAYLATLTESAEARNPWAYDFSHNVSVRGRTRYFVQKVTGTNSRNEFQFNDMTAYYLGPVNQFLTVFFETEFAEGFDPNVLAQGTLIFGNPDQYWYFKVGNMRLVRQGVGLLDRPKTIATDLAVSGRAHLFALNTDQRGVEVGYGFNQNRTVIRGFVMNGIDTTGNGQPVGRQDLNTQKDVALILENLFGENTATALSGLLYYGHTPFNATSNTTFYRLGLFGAVALNNEQNFEDIRLSAGVGWIGRRSRPSTERQESWYCYRNRQAFGRSILSQRKI